MEPSADPGSWPLLPHQGKPPPYATERFARFLERKKVTVLDVIRGASPDSRRLLVGNARTGTAAFAVAVAHRTDKRTPVDAEHDIVRALPDLLRGALAPTVPHLVERVEVTTELSGLVLTAVPGLRRPGIGRVETRPRPMLAAVDTWLAQVWEDTAGASAPVDLGSTASTALVTRYGGSTRLASALDSIMRARRALAALEAPLTLSHGCLCPRHIRTENSTVIGVDDWGLASQAADPLRDLGRFAVRVAEARLPEVVAGRTSYAGALRTFVAGGLERHDLPRELWREVLVMTQLELAVEALDRGDTDGISLLITAVRELPLHRRRNEARN